MAETAKYIWSAFDFTVATNGTRVGFQQADDNDISQTGILVKDVSFALASHKVIIDGMTLWINNFGNVVKTIPDSEKVGMTVRMVSCEMKTTYGTQQGITRGLSEGSESVATLSSMEPRDQFALSAMQAIMRTIPEPQSLDDANILFMCRASYRWAQGMMIASADARAERKKSTKDEEGDEESKTGTTRSEVDTSSGTDTEKLLSNLVSAIDDLTKQTKENNNALLKMTLKIDNAKDGDEDKKFQIEGAGGGGSSITRDDVNDSGDSITDVLVYNTAVGKAPLRVTISNLLKKLVSIDTAIGWIRNKGETNINSSAIFFTQYKDEIADALADKFDAKGSADKALNDAKTYTDSKVK